MRYQFIEEHRKEFPVRLQCRVLDVSASGFYAWRQRPRSPQAQANQRLSVQIRAVYQENRCVYGSPRIHLELRAQGIRCSEKRVARLMQAQGLRARVPRAFKVTTDSTHDQPVAANVLEQQFRTEEPNQVWCSDITYISTSQGWLYLAVVLDLYSRRVVGWALRPHLERELVCAALMMAEGRRGKVSGLLHHSDRGSGAPPGHMPAMSIGGCWPNLVFAAV